MNTIVFVILVLATWRISHLLAKEHGPHEILSTLRYCLGVRCEGEPPYAEYGKNVISKMIICVWCNSIWIGLFFTVLYVIWHPIWMIALPFALSAGAVMVDKFVTKETLNG